MKILITGSRGFIGSSIGRFATLIGHDVLGIGMSSQPGPTWLGAYRQADVSYDDLAEVVDEFAPDLVFHAAGTASVSASFTTPLTDLRAALLTWANTLDGVRRSGCRPQIIFPSSAAVYGNPVLLPVAEDAPISPISPYGYHKAACELVAREYADCFGLAVTVARIFSVFGPQQKRLLLWELYMQAAGPAGEVLLQGTGEETRDYLHVDDLSSIILKLAATPSSGYRVVNVGSGTQTNVRVLAELVSIVCGTNKVVRARHGLQLGNPSCWQADIRRIVGLGVWSNRPLEEAVSLCIEEWRSGG